MTSIARLLALACLLLTGFVAAQSCPVTPASDALRQITQCLAGQDCRGRTVIEKPNIGAGCEREIEVWSWHSNRASVAIRDRKMCLTRRKAQPDLRFVHGLLMPMAPVCGVEDPQLTAADSPFRSLWQDAWDAARRHLAEDDITLVINPPTLRSQTHLHIHIVRGNGVAFPAGGVVPLDNLADAWRQARAFAVEKLAINNGNYGIAIRRRGAGYDMLVEAGFPANTRNPESRYSIDED